MIKEILKTIAPSIIQDLYRKQNQKIEIKQWKKKGCPPPPPHAIKQQIIKAFQQKYSCHIMVETGTYMGAMVEAQKNNFKHIYSIELGTELFNKATQRFKKDKNVTIVHGDSGKVLIDIMSEINEPTLFWLDGHYSDGITARGDKDCPIYEEIDAIFSRSNYNHIILVDDARLFNGTGDYPTIEELTSYVKSKNDNYQCTVEHDIICYVV